MGGERHGAEGLATCVGTVAADAAAGAARGVARALGRSASATPGLVALRIDPGFVAHKAALVPSGRSVAVCGTNGKTTVTNMLAAVARSLPGTREVVCNAEGANMVTGVATALVGARRPDWAAYEVDELATRLLFPDIRPDVVVLLNLFRDQMDRSGEIDHTQDVLLGALAGLAGHATLVANADDPLVAQVGLAYSSAGGRVEWFGIESGLPTQASAVNEARLCPRCGRPLGWSYQTYAMMGHYACPAGDFARPEAGYAVDVLGAGAGGCAISVSRVDGSGRHALGRCSVALGGAYMAYDLAAVAVAAHVAGLAEPYGVTGALLGFAPRNGRQEALRIDGHGVLLNLAKNPSGFNQNLAMALDGAGDMVVCVCVNDGAQDGRDISWIWDVDFELLADPAVRRVMVGGTRSGDLAIRMRYAGVDAAQVGGMREAFSLIRDDLSLRGADVRVLCNYTALWPAKAELEGMERKGGDAR